VSSPRTLRLLLCGLLAALESDFRPRPVAISGLGLYRYVGGPWEKVAAYPFRGR